MRRHPSQKPIHSARSGLVGVLLMGLAACASPAPPPVATGPALPPPIPGNGLFGAQEQRIGDTAPFGRWREVRQRAQEEAALRSTSPCMPWESQLCGYQAYQKLLVELQNVPALERAHRINRFFNSVPYGTDRAVWGRVDYWATPGELLSARGDCEDYAVAKYMALRALGFAAEELRLVGVWDTRRRTQHALTAVRIGDQVWLLDNQSIDLVNARNNTRYRLIYSISERYWVRHDTVDQEIRDAERGGREVDFSFAEILDL
ncbi:MAG: transglutaminase-like cysteine peptidase [Magnetospiraceae bacterium]